MTNLYQILGVEKSASVDDIKKAYKLLAIKYHPDKGGDEKKFQEISNAYDILSDTKKKNEYDNGGQGQMNNDMFAHFFGGRNQRSHQRNNEKCNDINRTYKISLKDSFNGLKKTLKIKLKAYNLDKMKTCNKCNGSGRIKNIRNMGVFTQVIEMLCDSCQGCGSMGDDDAIYEMEKVLEFIIPKGIKNNNKICIDKCGEQPKVVNKIPGNLIFNIEIELDKKFIRNENNLETKIHLDFISSICGENIKLNILDDEDFYFNIKDLGIVHPNKKYEFKNKGMPIQGTNNRGNLLIEFEINYPHLNDDQRTNLSKSMTNLLSN